MTISTLKQDIWFTGGVPGGTVEDVFRLLAGTAGGRAPAYPDGENDERRGWIQCLPKTTWREADGIEVLESPLPPDHPQRAFDVFGVKESVSALHLEGLLPYSRAAIAGYSVFRRLRDEGIVPPEVRYQVAIPMAYDAVAPYFPHTSDWPMLFRAWTDAVQDEYRRILEVIPAEDLLVQLDYCVELVHMAGVLPRMVPWVEQVTIEEGLRQYASEEYLSPHTTGLPEDVALAYHICMGTFPVQPLAPLDDIGLPVAIANALVAHSGRRVDYLHLPAMREGLDEYFAPLASLRVGSSIVYIGLECNDGLEAMEQRTTSASRYLSNFGVAHYCGYAWNEKALPELLSVLRTGADHLRGTNGSPG